MASAANSLRLCLRTSRQASSCLRQPQVRVPLRRALSTTPVRWDNAATEEKDGVEESDYEFNRPYSNPGEFLQDFLRKEGISKADRAQATRMLETWKQVPPETQQEFDKLTRDISQEIAPLRRPVKPRRNSFWNEEEKDPDLITDEVGEDDFEEDDILSMGHGKLEEHREFREYARIAVWEMPLLSKLAKPFEPPTADQPLRFRYTTYMGEFHPADRKVVVEFCPKDLKDLTEAQQLKLKKLAGARYNPEKDLIKMSCERFEHQAQNKRYLGDLVQKMIATAKDPTDMFEDVPLDTRHHTFKAKPKFPVEWRMTEERKKELENLRRQALLLDQAKQKEGTLISGVERVQAALAAPPEPAAREPVMVRAGARQGARQGRAPMRR
ncbi:mitochondrial ribosomal subunit protein-domain-containing protein [Diplogelasinospora grovesii]|uniref:Mitochondrial ribosomal subunit protein-domain-containing protein n=1 Tax=Diplogelasinospora grovesii TaxID=303347 RepID=A0AAN6S1Q0_9PEZI|nr:mitochondrial ribosomal subunit protein-domain-containing protein [Diplogelasinospora grovesii]